MKEKTRYKALFKGLMQEGLIKAQVQVNWSQCYFPCKLKSELPSGLGAVSHRICVQGEVGMTCCSQLELLIQVFPGVIAKFLPAFPYKAAFFPFTHGTINPVFLNLFPGAIASKF